jgi:hypothetical protein
MKFKTVTHEFVEYVPDSLQPGVVYVSVKHATVVHSCCCGCRAEVVTPLSPASWTLVFDGATISLYPSIGNWHLPCRSHYVIRKSQVIWAAKWSEKRIEAARARDKALAREYFGDHQPTVASRSAVEADGGGEKPKMKRGWWRRRDR